ncbi:hypothetical protein HUJ04_011660 [Dendroctonus ponderosae]|nr:hypothetical protein HUJ04_011660 [Dendroctonus ponderosae]KAH1028812.1 hypothetical protein HUJ05_002142 [Dendroctonus ponderosae]
MGPLKIVFVLCVLTLYTRGAPVPQDDHAIMPPPISNDGKANHRSRRQAAPQWQPDAPKKPSQAEVVQNIFNIPISVLQAVSKLVSILPPGPPKGAPKRCGYNC